MPRRDGRLRRYRRLVVSIALRSRINRRMEPQSRGGLSSPGGVGSEGKEKQEEKEKQGHESGDRAKSIESNHIGRRTLSSHFISRVYAYSIPGIYCYNVQW